MQLAAPAALGADDAGRDGEIETQRITEGEDPFADSRLRVVAEGDGRKVCRVDLDHCHVGRRVAANDLGLEDAVVVERDGDAIRVGHDVIVGEDVAVGRHDEARTAGFLGLGVRRAELVEEILQPGTARAAGARTAVALPWVPRGLDRDHSGRHVLGDRDEALFCSASGLIC